VAPGAHEGKWMSRRGVEGEWIRRRGDEKRERKRKEEKNKKRKKEIIIIKGNLDILPPQRNR
jgi:hypothetical protein